MVKSISVLGSTGSVGRQTLEAAAYLGISVAAISGNRNISLLEEQVRLFRPVLAAVYDEDAAKRLKVAVSDTDTKVVSGMEGLIECAAGYGDCVVTAVSGSVGLRPTLAAIDEKKRIALANKETLVCAGELVMKRAKEKGAEIIPVDSEHSAIFQCLQAQGGKRAMRRILLTGSGGPFRGRTRAELEKVTPAQAVAHPNWSMGAKISVDSATLANKGLEFIEAMRLFSASPDEIKVIIHPESIIHSMVEFADGSVMAQLARPDMGLPIRYALCYPDREDSTLSGPDFTQMRSMSFFEPDLENFPCLALAMDCARKGGAAPAVFSAANEEAVALFLSERIGFLGIYELVAKAVSELEGADGSSLEALEQADREARAVVREKSTKF